MVDNCERLAMATRWRYGRRFASIPSRDRQRGGLVYRSLLEVLTVALSAGITSGGLVRVNKLAGRWCLGATMPGAGCSPGARAGLGAGATWSVKIYVVGGMLLAYRAAGVSVAGDRSRPLTVSAGGRLVCPGLLGHRAYPKALNLAAPRSPASRRVALRGSSPS